MLQELEEKPNFHEEKVAFIGRNRDVYLDKWASRENSTYKGWNFAAMFVPLEWMAYRKMYLEAFLYFLAAWIFSVLVILIFGSMGFGFVASGMMRELFRLVGGAVGNILYYRKVMRAIEQVKDMEETERLNTLSERGGVSFIGFDVCLLIQVVIAFLPLFI